MLALRKTFLTLLLFVILPLKITWATSTQFHFTKYENALGKIYRQLIFHSNKSLSARQIYTVKKYSAKTRLFRNKSLATMTILTVNNYRGKVTDIKYCQQLKNSSSLVEQKLVPWCFKQIIKRYRYKLRKNRVSHKEQNILFNYLLKNDRYLFILFKNLPTTLNRRATKQLLGYMVSTQTPLPLGLKKYMRYNNQLEDFLNQQEKPTTSNRHYVSYLLSQLYKNFKKASRENDFVKLQMIAQQAMSLYAEHSKDIPTKLHYIFVVIGREFLKKQYPKVAQQYFQNMFLTSKALSIKKRNTFLFYYLWSYIRNNQFQEVLQKIYKFQILDNLEDYSTKIKFWLAYTFQQTDEYKMAHYIYGEIIKENPLSYYAIMANGQLKYNQNSFIKRLFSLNNSDVLRLKKSKNSSKYGTKLREIAFWFTQKCPTIAHQQLSKLLNTINQKRRDPSSVTINKQLLMQQLANFLQSKKEYLSLFQAIFKNANILSKTTLKRMVQYLFPFDYFEQIKKLTSTINPIVILSLIRQESGFNPKAESLPGAKGLMQLMPQTAYELNIKNAKQLYIPKHNLQAGIQYFSQLLSTFDNNLILALAAYNAGPNRVKQWTTNILQNPNPLITIEDIPYRETRTYVKLIYRNIFFYNLLKSIRDQKLLSKR